MKNPEEKRPDYVLVAKEENLARLDYFLKNLKALGLIVENAEGVSVGLIFIKIFIPDEALHHFSQIYDIGTEDASVTAGFYKEAIFSSPFKTPVDETTPFVKGQFTGADKIIILNKVLENAKYGTTEKQFGITKLKKIHLIETFYPLHDGPATEDGTNQRSLLYRYWSNSAVTHMKQPLDLVYRYFGNEVAFYFAWLEYFNTMLALPAILGVLTFLISMIYLLYATPTEVKEICESHLFLCPNCEGKTGCVFKKLSSGCSLAQWTFIFDNNFTVAYAVFISLWATLFLSRWMRIENRLKFRWNCIQDVREGQIRQAYLEKATKTKINRLTGEIEPFTPKPKVFVNYCITILACAIFLGTVLCLVLVNMVLKIMFMRFSDSSKSKFLRSNAKIISMIIGSTVTVSIVKGFKQVNKALSLKLAHLENPRTQYEFDNSVLYKRFLFEFINYNIPVTYDAFFKGQFITLPHKMTFLRKDACQPCNCLVALCITLAVLSTVKTFLGNVFVAIFPLLKKCIRFRSHTNKTNEELEKSLKLPQWEKEYYLEPLKRFSVTSEFSEMTVRFGLISFFSKAFPLGALCILLNNLIELRSDAFKFVKSHRRPIPVEKSGVGAWNGIIRSLTYLSTAVNAFVIAITSDWVPKQVYHSKQGTLKGYVNSTLSKYATADNNLYDNIKNKPEFCYFLGKFYPPDHSERYTRTENYWRVFAFRLITIFIFEHIIFLCNSLFTYYIPYKSESVQLQLDILRQDEKENRIVEFEKKLKQNKAKKQELSEYLQGIAK